MLTVFPEDLQSTDLILPIDKADHLKINIWYGN